MKVLLVDDHPLFREGLAYALRADPALEVAAQTGSAAEVRALASSVVLDLAVIDLMIPSVSGIGLTRELRDLQPRCRVLGLSVIEEPLAIAAMLRSGASGYALKTQTPAEILEAIRVIAAGGSYLPPGVSREAIDAELAGGAPPPLAQLTRREREIFELMIRGHSNGDIAARLFISLRTVETHRHRIVKKMSARSIVELQRLAARYGGF